MPEPRPPLPLVGSLDDPERARDLARMKRLATGLFLLAAAVRSAAPGDEVTLTVRRGQATEQLDVSLGATEG